MKHHNILSLLLFLTLFVSCTKKETSEEQTTFFKGLIIYEETNVPFVNGQIEIIGSKKGSYGDYRGLFQIESDGTFDIKVTTIDMNHFQINLIPFEDDINWISCPGTGWSGFCTLFDVDKVHQNIKVLVSLVMSE